MTVATFTQPNFTTQLGNSYKGNIDGGFSVFSRIAGAFAAHEQSPPDMTVRVDAGPITNGQVITEMVAQNTGISPPIVPPTTNPRFDRIVVNVQSGFATVVTGIEAASPIAPVIPAGTIPIARVLLVPSSTVITNAMLTDERCLVPYVPPVAAGFVNGRVMYVETDAGGGSVTFDATSLIGVGWTSIGPTGSGMAAIWTALNSLPSTAKAVILKLSGFTSGTTVGQAYSLEINTRRQGSGVSVGDRTLALDLLTGQVSSASYSQQAADVATVIVPVSTLRAFEVLLSQGGTSGTNSAKFTLVGWLDSL